MNTESPPGERLQEAVARLEQKRPTADVLALIEDVAPGQPGFGQAQYLRGLCAIHDGQPERAKSLLIDAIQNGEQTVRAWVAVARTARDLDLPDDLLARLRNVLSRASAQQFGPFAAQVMGALGFTGQEISSRKDRLFTELLIPTLSKLLERREMDSAIALESFIYTHYVKPTETEAHFAYCMERIAPLFTAAAHAWRAELPALPQPALTAPYRIGFFLHNASTLAHIEVLLNTLKGYRMLDEQPFEPVVYCLGGKSAAMERAMADLGVRLVMLNERFPETQRSVWQRLLRFRELLSAEGIQELVWVSLVTMLPLAFGLRIAPVQTWLAMKYRNFSNEDIDGYLTGSALTRFGSMAGRRWRMGMLGVDDWYDASLEPRAAEIRAELGDRTVAMTLARTEKMQDPAYLAAMVEILRAHPQVVFLWAGREESLAVVEAFRAGGVLNQTRFIGWVNTRLYAQVADVFLDTFPFPCGFTLYQAMAAGKPVVVRDTPEAEQTGLWAFLKPLVEDGEGAPEERAEVLSFVGDERAPLIAIARSPQDYVRHAGRLIEDAEARAAAGEAARRFIARYFSDPRVLGESVGRHLVELIEERRGDGEGAPIGL